MVYLCNDAPGTNRLQYIDTYRYIILALPNITDTHIYGVVIQTYIWKF